MKLFLDSTQCLETCKESDCSGCDVNQDIVCHFNVKQALHFMTGAIPISIIGGVGIFQASITLFIVWMVSLISYFGFIEIRVMCSHCPHYAEKGLKKLKCWANYGAPKLWKYRPTPMSLNEKIVFVGGMAFVCLFPSVVTLLKPAYILFAIYTLSLIAGFYLLRTRLCTICMNFACPLNLVKQETRLKFFEHNPVIKAGWVKTK